MSKASARAARASWAVVVNALGGSALFPRRLRPVLLRALGARVGRRVDISRRVDILSHRLTLGDRVFVNTGVVIDNKAPVVLEDDVALAPGVLITSAHHDVGSARRRQGAVVRRPVRIGRGTWVGARAVILPGVTIGAGCVIAAGAVVTADCEPNSVYMGVPARFVRRLDDGPGALPEGRQAQTLASD